MFNEIGKHEGDVIIPRYSDLIYELRRQNDQIQIIISGILPRPIDYRQSAEITKRANKELKDWCSTKNHLHFNSTCKGFQTHNRPRFDLYATDGLHLNWQGTDKARKIMINLIALWRNERLTFR